MEDIVRVITLRATNITWKIKPKSTQSQGTRSTFQQPMDAQTVASFRVRKEHARGHSLVVKVYKVVTRHRRLFIGTWTNIAFLFDRYWISVTKLQRWHLRSVMRFLHDNFCCSLFSIGNSDMTWIEIWPSWLCNKLTLCKSLPYICIDNQTPKLILIKEQIYDMVFS